MTITVSSKGQVTLPAAARKRLGLRAGSRLEVIVTGDDRLEVIRVGGSLRDLKGLLPKPPRSLSLAEIDAAAIAGALDGAR
jgi:AbrB family looped-hinge helix DNA binding protein